MPDSNAAAVRMAPRTGRQLREGDVAWVGSEPRLRAARCLDCDTRVFPAATVCPSCNGERMAELPLSDTGTLYACSTVHIAPPMWETPYTIGYVDLPEGVRVFGKVEHRPALEPDTPVRVCLQPADDDPPSPAWRYWFVAA
jgi:uncharacterized OB-fold protein